MSIGIGLSIGASSGGGSVNTGVLQISGGAPLSGTLQTVVDQSNNASPLRLSTTQIAFAGFAGASTANIVWRANSILTDYTGWHQSDGTYRIITKDASSIFININDGVNFSAGFSSTGRTTINAAGNWSLGGSFGNAARLHVRGDGTNPITRFEDSTGTAQILQYETTGRLFGQTTNSALEMLRFQRNANRYLSYNAIGRFLIFSDSGGVPDGDTNYKWVNFSHSINTITSGTQTQLGLDTAISVSSGNPTIRIAGLNYTINNAGANTGVATGIFLNATETALNGMGHNLMDLQVGGVSRFRVKNDGISETTGYYFGVARLLFNNGSYATNRGLMSASGNGIFTLLNAAENDFGRLQLGGTTNAFPAIKRNGAAIDFRLADDSAFADINAANATFRSPVLSVVATFNASASGTGGIEIQSTNSRRFRILSTSALTTFEATNTDGFTTNAALNVGGSSANNASAILQADSTTRGFLPPRMTTTQINAIATPAEGLVVYNTTISHLCVYQAGAWVKLSHSPM